MYVDGFPTQLVPIRSIQLSLLKKGTEVDKYNKAEYFKKKTAKFTLPPDFPKTDEYFEVLLKDMFEELMIDAPDGADSLGLWIELDSITLDNSITLNTLNDIKMYSKEEVNPAWEFFKLTLI